EATRATGGRAARRRRDADGRRIALEPRRDRAAEPARDRARGRPLHDHGRPAARRAGRVRRRRRRPRARDGGRRDARRDRGARRIARAARAARGPLRRAELAGTVAVRRRPGGPLAVRAGRAGRRVTPAMPGRMISVVGCHAEGEVGDVIVGGVLPPPGATMFEKRLAMERDHDHIRKLLIREPRGSIARHVNLVLPPTRSDCDAGVIIMEPTEYPPMSGSNTIATVTVLLETGMLPMSEPETVVRLDMPGGLVIARARCEGG